ncbi:endolytic transglycosylase MltG [Brachybacterium timonense]|uniref:endolytic transglycosylase MltG n=1 Tax=Brachybacterium timonense TaxID=2050896 RepID=UPI000D0B7070|nr:endolytic transglycosylase MltG [Brachybacterium timonense]
MADRDDDLTLEDLVDEQAEERREKRRGRRRGQRRSPVTRFLPLVLVLFVVLGIGAGGVYGYNWVTSNVNLESEETDYPGPGSGEALVNVEEGDTGTDIAKKLVEADVIKSTGPFVTVFSNSPDAANIEPGVYRLKKQMAAGDALTMLLDPSSLAGHRVIIPEGVRTSKVWERVSKATGIPVEDFEKEAKDYTSFGIPKNPANSLEGYLWPGRYDIPEDASARDVIAMMWGAMEEQLTERNIPKEDWHRVLTLASIAEKEARDAEDYGKVVRAIENRLAGVGEAGGKPMRLQLDSTIAYVTGREAISTTPEERKADNPYNTYLHDGLPAGPIANPGAATIEAAQNPPEGTWLYWVTVNTDTGETKFADTYAEHQKNVAQWRAWAESKGG